MQGGRCRRVLVALATEAHYSSAVQQIRHLQAKVIRTLLLSMANSHFTLAELLRKSMRKE
eukprot:scaffold201335_cov18-Tisochrysis_lutea.AAC.1